jgi:hypothetical protein
MVAKVVSVASGTSVRSKRNTIAVHHLTQLG